MSIHRYETTAGIRYRVRWRDARGRMQSKSFATLGEARKAEAGVRLGHVIEPAAESRTMTVGEWLVEWFERCAAEWSITTRLQRKQVCDKWIFPILGDTILSSLRTRSMYEYRQQLLDEGASSKTANSVMAVLSAALGAAVRDDLLDTNPALQLRRLKTLPTSRRALSVLEVERIRDEMPTYRDQMIVSLIAYAGLRPAEVCGLKWRHIREHHILVEQSAQAGTIVATKTMRARMVPIGAELARDIAAYGRGADDDLVVNGDRGGILHWRMWNRRVWHPAIEAAGVKATPYDLRHTYVSLLIHSGATIPEVSAAVGHANPTMTLNTYSHVYVEAQATPRCSLDEAIRAARTERAASGRRGADARAGRLAPA